MKKLLAMLLAVCMVLALCACGSSPAPAATEAPAAEPAAPAAPAEAETTEITLWTYPIGKWGDEATVKTLTDAFTAETGIKVNVEYLAYADGDDKVNTAIAAGQAPDLIMEGPERLVANWGANGHMVNIADLFDDTDKAEINAAALAACFADDATAYEYPVCTVAHCMAINYTAFVEAGADKYVDLETRTWSAEDFQNAVAALTEKFGGPVAAVFCQGQGGDQGTRALVNNLCGGSFANAEHTAYTWDDPKNIEALEMLKGMDGVSFDASLAGGDEMNLFRQGVLKMAFCWNASGHTNTDAGNEPGKTIAGDEVVCMQFPTADGGPAALQGGIWGFGIFDNGDAAKIEAAKSFIKYFCDSPAAIDAVKISGFFPARTTADDGKVDMSESAADDFLKEYSKLILPALGDYYQVTKGWAGARTAWWNMLQAVGGGADITETVASFCAEANAG